MNIKILTVTALLTLSGTTQALVMEAGDAGQLTGTAQMLPGGTTMIMGQINPFGDADLYGFSWGGGAFGATTAGASIDTQLFLFDAGGNGIVSNDDTAGFSSTVSANLAAGMYFIGISIFNNEPIDAANNLMFVDGISGQNAPTGFGPLAGWDGAQAANPFFGTTTGPYLISFRQPGGGLPEPGMVALLGLGLVGLGLRRRFA